MTFALMIAGAVAFCVRVLWVFWLQEQLADAALESPRGQRIFEAYARHGNKVMCALWLWRVRAVSIAVERWETPPPAPPPPGDSPLDRAIAAQKRERRELEERYLKAGQRPPDEPPYFGPWD